MRTKGTAMNKKAQIIPAHHLTAQEASIASSVVALAGSELTDRFVALRRALVLEGRMDEASGARAAFEVAMSTLQDVARELGTIVRGAQ